ILSTAFQPETSTVQIKAVFSKPIQSILLDSIYLTLDPVPLRVPKEKPDDKKRSKKEKQEQEESKKDTIPIKPITKIHVALKNIRIDSSKNLLTISSPIDKKLLTEKIDRVNAVFEELFLLSVENDTSRREVRSI